MASNDVMLDEDQVLIELEKENIEKQTELLRSLYAIWNKVGVDVDQKVYRSNQVWGYVFNLLKDIVDEETGLYEEIKDRVKNYEEKISQFLTELQLPKEEVAVGTLIVQEETLRRQLDKLSKIRHKRISEYDKLHSLEMKYCRLLGMPPHKLSSTTGVPSEEDIQELQQHVHMLQEEKETREKRFLRLKKELTTILEITELTPETALEKEILSHSEEDNFSLSTETFRLLEDIVIKKKNKKAGLEAEKAALMEKLTMLWDVMKIDKEEREKFLAKHTGCRLSNLNAIKEEIARCEEIKQKNISKYVDSIKEELLSLWNNCFITHSESMLPQINEEINESVLEMYDKELVKWRKYYTDTEHIIKKIEKRRELWNQVIALENKATDPNRFKNRGGKLLQEERQRKQLQKVLPELEEQILLDIQNYEKETGKTFLYFGEKFDEYLQKEWNDRHNQKENEKQTRQKMRTNQIVNERTPAKRQLSTLVPKSAPSKLFKSSAGVSVYRTPTLSVVKQVPSTVARLKNSRQKTTPKTERKVLKEKNGNKPDVSESLDSTTYTEFAEKLERSSRIAHRSSVLSSRKIVGTRISINKSKRKSASKPTRKSLRKKTETSKILTPARGKLGLPFLI